jgi:hypothetical protein
MKKPIIRKLRCAVYTRKSTEEGLDQEFNSLDAQREACEAYVASQKAEGWLLVPIVAQQLPPIRVKEFWNFADIHRNVSSKLCILNAIVPARARRAPARA